jgi:hypothetical protein
MTSLRPPVSTKGLKLSDVWGGVTLIIVGIAILIGYVLEARANHRPPPSPTTNTTTRR